METRKGLSLVLLTLVVLLTLLPTGAALGTPDPSSVTVSGSLQSELGSPGDWDPTFLGTHLSYGSADDVWQATWTIPAGTYEYKVALNDSWTENYGLHAEPNGNNIPLVLAAATAVTFYYDRGPLDHGRPEFGHPGGCRRFPAPAWSPGDWDPGNLRSWYEDPDGDGIYSFTSTLPAGDYEYKVALNKSWTENYGLHAQADGPNIPLSLAADGPVTFYYDPKTHWAADSQGSVIALVAGSFQSELGGPGDWDPADFPLLARGS